MPRITINEIARRTGVSKGAVSYALNGRPGVSEATRERILTVARELGWAPNRTARLLSGSRTDTFGLILARDARTLGLEPFYMEFVAGLESELGDRSYALLLQVTPSLEVELETYRKWSSERRVDAVVVVDLRVDDPRLALLDRLEIPAVFVGDPSVVPGHTCVWTDDRTAMAEAVAHLVELGHRRLARVAGISDFAHVAIRDEAFGLAVERAGVQGTILHADFSGEEGKRATRELVLRDGAPTAILFDNDLMAIASLAALSELGIEVPDDVTLLAWDDSPLCSITHPQLSAMSHDVVAFGAHVARRLFAVLEGAPPAAHLDSTPQFRRRGSTTPPRTGPLPSRPVGG
ncbi:LacI family DNA-binding transcriptional regulator [Microlunatus panaciterrae]|uniref:DNA-binding LacI/PurR family transcriptional regulator n=1 Tax=Microlunatus panaciterrae TaxID=400768 RepID=A0ABS2RL64_9ACTN|nr:LacI family DNA-binding transcriptional regulator [Microlunatus panaciterrae]MBM7799750.1 DNA-binding LacI/PurR family transcriptional regulator [Microlunatus panaciterrae]